MIGIEHVWGAVGCAFGVCFAATVMTIELLIEDYHKQKRSKE